MNCLGLNRNKYDYAMSFQYSILINIASALMQWVKSSNIMLDLKYDGVYLYIYHVHLLTDIYGYRFFIYGEQSTYVLSPH